MSHRFCRLWSDLSRVDGLFSSCHAWFVVQIRQLLSRFCRRCGGCGRTRCTSSRARRWGRRCWSGSRSRAVPRRAQGSALVAGAGTHLSLPRCYLAHDAPRPFHQKSTCLLKINLGALRGSNLVTQHPPKRPHRSLCSPPCAMVAHCKSVRPGGLLMLRGDGPACVNLLSVANLYTSNPEWALALAFLSLSLCLSRSLFSLSLSRSLSLTFSSDNPTGVPRL